MDAERGITRSRCLTSIVLGLRLVAVSESRTFQESIAVLVRASRLYAERAPEGSDPTVDQVRQAIAKVSEQHDPGGLALILDDELAPRVLAWWQASRATLDNYAEIRGQLAVDVQAHPSEVDRTIDRCKKVRLLENGGISQLAAGFLRNHVAQSVGVKRKKSK